jgi:hypothetical protein
MIRCSKWNKSSKLLICCAPALKKQIALRGIESGGIKSYEFSFSRYICLA